MVKGYVVRLSLGTRVLEYKKYIIPFNLAQWKKNQQQYIYIYIYIYIHIIYLFRGNQVKCYKQFDDDFYRLIHGILDIKSVQALPVHFF